MPAFSSITPLLRMDPLLQLPETIPEQQQTLHDGAAQSGSLGPGSEQLPTTLGA